MLHVSHSLNEKPNNLFSFEKERNFVLLMLGSVNVEVHQRRAEFFDTESEKPNDRTLFLQNS